MTEQFIMVNGNGFIRNCHIGKENCLKYALKLLYLRLTGQPFCVTNFRWMIFMHENFMNEITI